MALSKNKIRKILQRNLMGGELTRKEIAIQYLAVIAVFMFVIPIYIFLIRVMPISIPEIVKHLISFIIFGVVVTAVSYFLIFRARKSDRANLELAGLEEQQEDEAKKILIDKLGKQIFLNLNPAANAMNVNQTELCNALLIQDEVKSNGELSFHLHLKRYWFHFIAGDYLKAIKALESALEIYPNDIITNIRLAEAYEYVGNGDKAVDRYRTIMDSLPISSKSKEYIGKQIERVGREGPKKAPPMPGFRYMTH